MATPPDRDRTEPIADGALSLFPHQEHPRDDLGIDRRRPRIVEVGLVWRDTLLFLDAVDPEQRRWRYDRLPGGAIPLVQRDGQRVTVRVPAEVEAYLEQGLEGRRTPVERRCELPYNGRLVIVAGEVLVFVQQSHQSRPLPATGVPRAELPLLFLFLLTALGALAAAMFFFAAPGPPGIGFGGGYSAPTRLVSLQVGTGGAPGLSNAPTAMPVPSSRETEGRAGDEEGRLQRARGTRVAVPAAEADAEIVANTGLLAELSGQAADGDLYGAGGFAVAHEGSWAGGALGSRYGNQYGFGGLGARGGGLGGGGTGEGLGGLCGNVQTGRGCTGRGRGASGYGAGGGYFGRKSGGTPSMSTGDPIVVGHMDKSIIDRVIKQHLAQIRYCYQKELQRDPDLAGKVTVRFVIDATGHVSSSTVESSTLDNARVEDCVCDRISKIWFGYVDPAGIVIVHYPFVFNTG